MAAYIFKEGEIRTDPIQATIGVGAPDPGPLKGTLIPLLGVVNYIATARYDAAVKPIVNYAGDLYVPIAATGIIGPEAFDPSKWRKLLGAGGGAGLNLTGSVPTVPDLPAHPPGGDGSMYWVTAGSGAMYIFESSHTPNWIQLGGVTGPPGPQGTPGVDGAKGDKGDQGDKGDPGVAGVDGKDGKDGKDGNPLQIDNSLSGTDATKALGAPQGRVLAGKIATASATIALNTTRIATNAAAIAKNTKCCTDTKALVATNTTDIATNTGDIAKNTAQVATNTTDIATNTGEIAKNKALITTNTAAIATNKGLIVANQAAIAVNLAAIATKADKVHKHTLSQLDTAFMNTNLHANTHHIVELSTTADKSADLKANQYEAANVLYVRQAIAALAAGMHYVGNHHPTTASEYPGSPKAGYFWVVNGLGQGVEYTFAAGALNGAKVEDGDMLLWSEVDNSWHILGPVINLSKLIHADGTVDMTGALKLRNQASITPGDREAISFGYLKRYGLWHKNAKGIDYGGGNVGIGTTNPVSKLSVKGDTLIGGKVRIGATRWAPTIPLQVDHPQTNNGKRDIALTWYGATAASDGYGFRLDATNSSDCKMHVVCAMTGASDVDVMTFKPDGNVGIAVTDPKYKLHVKGEGQFDGPGTAKGGVWIGTDTATHNYGAIIGWNEASQKYVNLRISANATTGEQLVVASNGNVGINRDNPQYKLEVNGETFLHQHLILKGGGAWIRSDTNAGMTLLVGGYDASGSKSAYMFLEGADYSGTGKGGKIVFLPMDGKGVGIGTATPSAKLTVGESLLTTTTKTLLTLENTNGAPSAISNGIALDFHPAGPVAANPTHRARIIALEDPAAPGAVGLEFHVTDLTHSNKAMVISPTGNVGIGTNNPTHRLEVQGTGKFTKALTLRNQATGAIALDEAITYRTLQGHQLWTKVTGGIEYAGGNVGVGSGPDKLLIGGAGSLAFLDAGAVKWTISKNRNNLELRDAGGHTSIFAATGDLTIVGDYHGLNADLSGNLSAKGTGYIKGNIGIGKTPSAHKLDVAGDALISTTLQIGTAANKKIVSSFAFGTSGFYFHSKKVWRAYSSTDGNFYIRDDTDVKNFTFHTDGQLTILGKLTAAGTVYPSDMRLKENVTPIYSALGKIEQLQGFTYNLKSKPGERLAGLSAQEVQSVQPESVFEGDDKYLTLDYGSMVPLLVEGIKDLSEENRLLRAQAQQHEDKLSRMEDRLAKLEALIQGMDNGE